MVDINVNSLEPNSHKYKAEKTKEELMAQKSRDKISPVVKQEQVVSTRKPLSKKFAETFITEDVKDLKSWLLFDIVIPGIKNVILDGLSMMFFGEMNSRTRTRRRNRYDDDRRDYSGYYRGRSDRVNYDYRRNDDFYKADSRVDFRNIILRTREDAENVIRAMRDLIRNDGTVSIAQLLDLIDVPSRYTDNNYGWDDEREIGIRRVSSGYLIDVCEPKYLD